MEPSSTASTGVQCEDVTDKTLIPLLLTHTREAGDGAMEDSRAKEWGG